MITARDMMPGAAFAAAAPVAAAPARRIERWLIASLFIAMLASSVAFIEPSPHDALMGLVALLCLVAGVKIPRSVILLLLLLLLWNGSGLFSLMNTPDDSRSIQYFATSFYMSIAGLIFASLFADNTLARLDAMRDGYLASAAFAALLGIAGYFHLFPGSDFLQYQGRAMGMFKDPNVFGPYLIWPMLFLTARLLTQRFSLVGTGILGLLLVGLLLSFSRGAWGHFVFSGIVMFALLLLTTRDPRRRFRLLALGIGGAVITTMLVGVLLSMDSVQQMFDERAQLLQSYDVGEGGRFRLQLLALGALLENFSGMSAFEFARLHVEQQHNVYLQGFIVYGWTGGVAYIVTVIATLWIGLRAALCPAPWQLYAITAYAAFVGEVAEGFIIDTDHWRHFFLLLGVLWGLYAANVHARHHPGPAVNMRALA